MAQQRILHGATLEIPTADEIVRLIPRPPQETRMRVPETVKLDAGGYAILDVYKVPIGAEFGVRRVVLDLGSVQFPTVQAGIVLLNSGSGTGVRYLRSGRFIEWGLPASPQTGAPGVPGVQTWGAEQGPYLRNGEVFGVELNLGATAALNSLTVTVEGILRENPRNA